MLPIFLHFISNSFLDFHLILFSFRNRTEGNSINWAIQSNHSFAKCALTLQVLELTDALAVNSTAVRLEWHLLLSDTEYYIEVIQRNNLIDFAIRLLKHSSAAFVLTRKLLKILFFLLIIQQGLYIRYRDLNSDAQKYDSVTVMKPDSEMHDVANLNKFSKYEFFISPFYRSVEGQPSNSKIVQTLEDGEWLFLYSFSYLV